MEHQTHDAAEAQADRAEAQAAQDRQARYNVAVDTRTALEIGRLVMDRIRGETASEFNAKAAGEAMQRAAVAEASVANLRAALERAQDAEATAHRELGQAQAEVTDLKAAHAEARQTLEQLTAELRGATTLIGAQRTKLEELGGMPPKPRKRTKGG